jgi:hypothetical protein
MRYNKSMTTKHTEHTANVAMAQATTLTNIKVGANFAKPIPRKIAEKKKSFWAQFKKV